MNILSNGIQQKVDFLSFMIIWQAAGLFHFHAASSKKRFADAAGFLRADGNTAHTGNTGLVIGFRRFCAVDCSDWAFPGAKAAFCA